MKLIARPWTKHFTYINPFTSYSSLLRQEDEMLARAHTAVK